MKKPRVKTCIQWFDAMWSKVTGRKHNLRVVFGYKQKGQTRSTEITMCRTFTMDWMPGGDDLYRELKKHFGPAIVEASKERYGRLNNGHITIEDISYIGRF